MTIKMGNEVGCCPECDDGEAATNAVLPDACKLAGNMDYDTYEWHVRQCNLCRALQYAYSTGNADAMEEAGR
jgi:hypothetical protein